MYVNKNFNLKAVMRFTGWYLVWIVFWNFLIVVLYKFIGIKWIIIPWASVGIIGTAVSFYIGFKNNQAYDRIWEARKIWGSILNTSRMWATNLQGYITIPSGDQSVSEAQINSIIKKMIYRHIAYVYALRDQLLIPAPWEHISLTSYVGKTSKDRMEKFGIGMLEDNLTQEILKTHLDDVEYEELKKFSNLATHLIQVQSQNIKQLRKDNFITEFYQIELQKLLNDFYSEQGKAERIKKFPLPRAYAFASIIFIAIFIFLLPLGLINEFDKLGIYGLYLFVPVVSIVAWIFLLMELVGDYSENPFEGLGNDIPMFSICRTIEIDLKELIKDEIIPEPVKAEKGILL